MNRLPRGIIPPIVVPFDINDEIDEALLRKDIRFLLTTGIHGLSSGGSTGEGAILSDEELIRCLAILRDECPAGFPVIAGIIRNSSRDAVRCSVQAENAGADALLVTPPFYYGATLEGNVQYYSEIANAVSLPLLVYNVVSTNPISPEAFLKLIEIDTVKGIKQVDPVIHAQTVALHSDRPDIKTYSACDSLLYSTYVAGSDGAISALATIAPKQCVQQWNAFLSGDQQTASRIQRDLLPIVRLYQKPPFPGRVKALLNEQGRQVGSGRKPNSMPSFEDLQTIKTTMKRIIS